VIGQFVLLGLVALFSLPELGSLAVVEHRRSGFWHEILTCSVTRRTLLLATSSALR
jgi:hypothetical protein